MRPPSGLSSASLVHLTALLLLYINYPKPAMSNTNLIEMQRTLSVMNNLWLDFIECNDAKLLQITL